MKTSVVRFTARSAFAATLCLLVAPAYAAKSTKVTMNLITADGVGKSVGTITIKEGKDGVTFLIRRKNQQRVLLTLTHADVKRIEIVGFDPMVPTLFGGD